MSWTGVQNGAERCSLRICLQPVNISAVFFNKSSLIISLAYYTLTKKLVLNADTPLAD